MSWLTNRAAWRQTSVRRCLGVGLVMVAVMSGSASAQGWHHAVGMAIAATIGLMSVVLCAVYGSRFVRDTHA